MHHPADTLRNVLQSAQAHLQAAIPAKGQECPDQVAVSDASMIDSDNYKEIDSTPHQIRPMSSASCMYGCSPTHAAVLREPSQVFTNGSEMINMAVSRSTSD